MGHIQSLPLSSSPFPPSQLCSPPFSSLFEIQITETVRKLSQRKSHSSKNLNEVVEQVRLASGERNPRRSKQQLQSPPLGNKLMLQKKQSGQCGLIGRVRMRSQEIRMEWCWAKLRRVN